MAGADLSTPRSLRLAVAVFIVLMHIAVILGLVRAFAPDFTASVVRNVSSVLTVTVTTATPTPEPSQTKAAAKQSGAAGQAGKKARPKEVAAPKPKIAISKVPAPQASSTGTEIRSGASEAGEGTGAAGQGAGTGAGGSGSGQGGGGSIRSGASEAGEGTGAAGQGAGTGAGGSGSGQGGGGSKAQKISGDINSARDYPREGRDLRIGDHVIIVLTVGTDGRARNCRVRRPSRDAKADSITCELAKKRFRFRPATNASGQPVESFYGWKQRWFYPGKN